MKWIEDNIILKVYRGSHSYGTSHETSDIDLGAITIPSREYIIGFENFEQYISKEYYNFGDKTKKAEIAIYGLHKFFNLAFNCNPNIVEHLFVDDKHIIFYNDIGKMIMDNKFLFLTKRARHTFGGYAYSQLKRLTNKLPVDELKTRLNNLNERIRQYNIYITKLEYKLDILKKSITEITDNDAEMIISLTNEIQEYNNMVNKANDEIIIVKKEIGKGQHNHIGSHKGLIEDFGYDVKHSLHLIRLLNQGIEILETGELHVLRPEKDYLLDIRHGKYTLEQVKSHAEQLFIKLDEAYEKSKLPHSPDRKKINDLLCDITLMSFNK